MHLTFCFIPLLQAMIEIVKRHIMAVDEITYEAACTVFTSINNKNKEYHWVINFPFYVGITLSVGMGVISLPMVFDLQTAEWFNEHYVSTLDFGLGGFCMPST